MSLHDWRDLVTYLFLLRVPLLTATFLLAFPYLALRPARTLLAGLFDLGPAGMFAVSLATTAAALTAEVTARSLYLLSPDRLHPGGLALLPFSLPRVALWGPFVLCLPILWSAFRFSSRLRRAETWRLLGALAAGVLLVLATGGFLHQRFIAALPDAPAAPAGPSFLAGYTGHLRVHAAAALAFGLLLLVYAALGVYGYFRLGRQRTVPALCSTLMLVMLACWGLSGLTFFVDRYRIPVLLLLLAWGAITSQSVHSDHYYVLQRVDRTPAPGPAEVLAASPSGRAIVVAANGGGIQSAAWAAQVLSELSALFPDFPRTLRLVSSVSGGSIGAAFYLNSILHPGVAPPALAARISSLDEVAWGLSWPDFLRALMPWLFAGLIGRGRAIERAWCHNAAPNAANHLDDPLCAWNVPAASGRMPAVIFNATICETGERLLLGTTQFGTAITDRARRDGAGFHGPHHDLSIISAARLSATFPYVTPVSRSQDGPSLHVADGGYYDNYGMSTLVEWLDEGLTGVPVERLERVLVIQIHGAPIKPAPPRNISRGWFFQATAPLTTLAAVRTAGQAAHNDVELELLRQKWPGRIETVLFEFPDTEAPLSWHLTDAQQTAIDSAWQNHMGPCINKVRQFLSTSAGAAASVSS